MWHEKSGLSLYLKYIWRGEIVHTILSEMHKKSFVTCPDRYDKNICSILVVYLKVGITLSLIICNIPRRVINFLSYRTHPYFKRSGWCFSFVFILYIFFIFLFVLFSFNVFCHVQKIKNKLFRENKHICWHLFSLL